MTGFLVKPKSPSGRIPSSAAPKPAKGISDSSVVRRDHDTRHPESQRYMRRERKGSEYC
jgi:hypothetical protein